MELFLKELEDNAYFSLERKGLRFYPVWAGSGLPAYARRPPHYPASAMDGIAVWAADTYGASEINCPVG